jgi:hypothetical protein
MEAMQKRFRELTGDALMIELPDTGLTDLDVFRRLEAAATKVIEAVEEIPPNHLRNPREAAQRGLYPRISVDGFGKHDDVRSLDEVRDTVREFFYVE